MIGCARVVIRELFLSLIARSYVGPSSLYSLDGAPHCIARVEVIAPMFKLGNAVSDLKVKSGEKTPRTGMCTLLGNIDRFVSNLPKLMPCRSQP